MPQYQNFDSGTAIKSTTSLTNNCDNCPVTNKPQSSTTSDSENIYSYITYIATKVEKLDEKMHELEATTKETQSFYDSTTKLNKTVQIAVMLLISVPIVQLVFATLMVYYLGIQDDLNGLLHWLLGSISFFFSY